MGVRQTETTRISNERSVNYGDSREVVRCQGSC